MAELGGGGYLTPMVSSMMMSGSMDSLYLMPT